MTYALRGGFKPSTAVRWISSAQYARVLPPAKSEVVQGRCLPGRISGTWVVMAWLWVAIAVIGVGLPAAAWRLGRGLRSSRNSGKFLLHGEYFASREIEGVD